MYSYVCVHYIWVRMCVACEIERERDRALRVKNMNCSIPCTSVLSNSPQVSDSAQKYGVEKWHKMFCAPRNITPHAQTFFWHFNNFVVPVLLFHRYNFFSLKRRFLFFALFCCNLNIIYRNMQYIFRYIKFICLFSLCI